MHVRVLRLYFFICGKENKKDINLQNWFDKFNCTAQAAPTTRTLVYSMLHLLLSQSNQITRTFATLTYHVWNCKKFLFIYVLSLHFIYIKNLLIFLQFSYVGVLNKQDHEFYR